MLKPVTLADITITTAGTRKRATVALSDPTAPVYVSTIVFSAPSGNTGNIFIGDSAVSSSRGIEVIKGASLAITADMSGRAGGEEFDLADFYIDAATNGDKVKVSYITRR